jgi:transposase
MRPVLISVAGIPAQGGTGMKVAAHHTEQHLQRFVEREVRADRAQRLRTVLLAKRGFTAPEVATCTGFSRRTVQHWVARYNAEGLAGLQTKPGRGRKPPLTQEQEQQLRQRLDSGPRPEDGVCTLRGKDVQRILQQEFGQLRSLNAVYDLLHRLGYSSLVPRPQHPQSDPAAQEVFKKSLASGSPRSKRSIPRAGSRSSTKTKRGLASKAH